MIGINRDPSTGLYLFPDTSETLDQFREFQAGHLNQLFFESRSEHESQTENRAQTQAKRDKMQ